MWCNDDIIGGIYSLMILLIMAMALLAGHYIIVVNNIAKCSAMMALLIEYSVICWWRYQMWCNNDIIVV